MTVFIISQTPEKGNAVSEDKITFKVAAMGDAELNWLYLSRCNC